MVRRLLLCHPQLPDAVMARAPQVLDDRHDLLTVRGVPPGLSVGRYEHARANAMLVEGDPGVCGVWYTKSVVRVAREELKNGF